MALSTGSGSQSSRAYTGVGPKHAFIFSGVSSPVVTNVIGLDITVAQTDDPGKYTVTHNLGHTNYVGIFTSEDNAAATNPTNVRIYNRAANTCQVWIEDDAGALTNPDFVHGVIYD